MKEHVKAKISSMKVTLVIIFCTFISFLSHVIVQMHDERKFRMRKKHFWRKDNSEVNETFSIQFIEPLNYFYNDYFERCHCKHSCRLILDKNPLNHSRVVLFHGWRINKMEIDDLFQKKPTSQRWGYFLLENPKREQTIEMIKKYGDYFDFSITMSHKSNFQFRPFAVKKLKKKLQLNRTFNYAAGKTKMVAWYVSNCAKWTKYRQDFIDRLQSSGVSVNVGGLCSKTQKKKLPTCLKNNGYFACESILKNFKFYFAAENDLCNDYITEKYYLQGSLGNTIPIVLGAGNYSDPKNAIPMSFINPLDFKNFDEFSSYIKMLDKNDTAFNEYFQWKDSWTIIDYKVTKCAPFICDICTNLHEGGGNLVGGKLSEQYSPEQCLLPRKKYDNWFKL